LPTARAIGNFQLVDQSGFAHELHRLKDARAVVIAAHAVGDPASRRAAETLARLKAEHPELEVMMVNSRLEDDRAEIEADAAAMKAKVAVLDDADQLAGELLGLSRAGEVVVLNPSGWKVVYQGALDKDAASAKAAGYLEAAVADVMAGRTVKVASTKAKGATIAFPERARAAEHAKISYSETVAPIIEAKCAACHAEGGIAPFAFDSYAKVKGFAPMIAEAIRTDRMPPWAADPHVGKFSNDKSLTSAEIKTLGHWIEAGAPRGAGPDPLAVKRPVAAEWPLGEPDLILEIPPYTIPASGVVEYQYPYVLNPLTEGKWLKASTAKAGSRQGVHHILGGTLAKAPEPGKRSETGWISSVVDYAVGAESTIQPENLGVWVQPGGAIGFQLHYTPYGKETVDKSKLGLYFYKDGETPELMMREVTLVDSFIELPPYEGAHKEVAYLDFPKDALLYSAFPHAHYRGTYSDLKIRYPDGKEKTLLRLPRYDFGWQRYYDFAEPVSVPAGSKLIATYIYDNSKRNPANPDPSKTIVWGDQSFEEMFFTKLRYRWLDETTAKPTKNDQLLAQGRMIGMIDDNADGAVQKAELKGQLKAVAAKFEEFDADKSGALTGGELMKAAAALRGARSSGDAS
jgi:mono/diheme cytochrome c family protein